MMLGFVVRQCAIELGHPPDAAELTEWANYRRGFDGFYRVFGRAISVEEAEVILRNPERVVAIHPEWEARRPPASSRPALEEGPGQVIELSAFRRAR
jgi:hypothetical protein